MVGAQLESEKARANEASERRDALEGDVAGLRHRLDDLTEELEGERERRTLIEESSQSLHKQVTNLERQLDVARAATPPKSPVPPTTSIAVAALATATAELQELKSQMQTLQEQSATSITTLRQVVFFFF
jgi:predicted nuclease with TOPRIM domain